MQTDTAAAWMTSDGLQVEYSMFCRLALPKIRTLTVDDEVIVCSWQRVRPPDLLYLTCGVTFTVDATIVETGVGRKLDRRIRVK